ncbi:MAG: hypothetical protein ACKVYV_06710 [Limisphaerales bacterium]
MRIPAPFPRLTALLAAGFAGSARGELVYANTNQFRSPPASYVATNAYSVLVPDGQGGQTSVPAGQFGDSIQLTTPGEFNRFRFSYLSGLGANGTLDGATMVLRFYANDGPLVNAGSFGSVNLPGTLLYQSDPFAIDEGSIVVTLSGVPSLMLPQSLTWAVEYRNVDLANVSLGLPAYDPPSIGGNPGYYLLLDGNQDWVLYPPAIKNGATIPGNFPAEMDFIPIPEPGVATLAGMAAAAFLLHSRRSRTRRRE